MSSSIKPGMAKELATDILFDLVGGVVYAVSVNVFTAPNHIAPGGVTGFATLMNYVFGIPIGVMSLMINIPLLLVALRFLGKGFFLRTLKTVFVMTTMVDSLPLLISYTYEGERILAGLMGGVLTGLSIALPLMRGSTTGGFDVVSRLVKLRMPHFSIGRLLFIADFTVILVSMLVYGNIESGLYGLIAIFACSRMVDSVLYGMDKGKMIHVISNKSAEVAKEIYNTIGRGATLLDAHGSYKNEARQVLLCAVRDHQYPLVKKAVYRVDPQAFVMVNEATDILGLGFRRIDDENK